MISRFVPILSKLKALKSHGRLMWHAFRHAETPKWIKAFMIAVAVYLVSPIDFVPDFALILGLTDDAIVITLAMWFLGRMIPETVKREIEQSQPLGAANAPKVHDRKVKPAGKSVHSQAAFNWKAAFLTGLLLGFAGLAILNAETILAALQGQ